MVTFVLVSFFTLRERLDRLSTEFLDEVRRRSLIWIDGDFVTSSLQYFYTKDKLVYGTVIEQGRL